MATLSIRQIALICLAAVAFYVLYYLSQKTDLEQHARNAQTLQNLKHWDSILKRDVLRTRTGMLNHYDTLVSTMKALKAAHARISENPNALPEDNGGYFQKSVETLGKNLTSRALDLERFKMRNAILRNSLSYLPVAAGRLTERLSKTAESTRLAADTSGVLRDALIYNLSGDIKLRKNLQEAVAALESVSERADAAQRFEVENILSHIAVIMTQKPALDVLVSNLMSIESATRIDEVTQNYNVAFKRLEEQAEMYRSLLFVLAVLTVLYVAFVLMQLNRAATSLEAANTELEERVARRTAQLTETNSSLQIHLDRIGVAMERAERGDLGIHLPEEVEGVYATLYRRFNHMIDGIRDEAEILKVAQELSGELKLDALLTRIMGTTTDLLDADRSTIFVHDRNANEL